MTVKGTSILRAQNEKRILSFLRRSKTSSRKEMADVFGLSKNTVSMIVDKLLQEGIIMELGLDQMGVGRPRVELTLVAQARHAIGLLIRDTHCDIVVTDYYGNIVETDVLFVDATNVEQCIVELSRRCMSLLQKYKNVLGIGVAIPGMVDPVNGIVRYSTHLQWRDVHIVELLQQDLGMITIQVLNRVKAAALSPVRVVPEDANSTFYIRIDEGVGGAFVLGHDIVQGVTFTAGEFGHVVVAPQGPLCSCGQRGCLESLISLPVVQAKFHGTLPEEDLGTDVVGFTVLQETGEYLGKAMAMVINLFNPEYIVIDSPFNHLTPFKKAVLETVRDKSLWYPFEAAHFVFSHTPHSSAWGMAFAIILEFEGAI